MKLIHYFLWTNLNKNVFYIKSHLINTIIKFDYSINKYKRMVKIILLLLALVHTVNALSECSSCKLNGTCDKAYLNEYPGKFCNEYKPSLNLSIACCCPIASQCMNEAHQCKCGYISESGDKEYSNSFGKILIKFLWFLVYLMSTNIFLALTVQIYFIIIDLCSWILKKYNHYGLRRIHTASPDNTPSTWNDAYDEHFANYNTFNNDEQA